MKSQSTIIGRLFGDGFFPYVYKEVRYWIRRSSGVLGPLLVGVLAGLVFTGLILTINAQNNEDLIHQAKLYHYTVGSVIKCNASEDSDTHVSGWVPCKVLSISKNNEYYTTSFHDPDAHKDIQYKFKISDVGNK
jgi:hypothetical protein